MCEQRQNIKEVFHESEFVLLLVLMHQRNFCKIHERNASLQLSYFVVWKIRNAEKSVCVWGSDSTIEVALEERGCSGMKCVSHKLPTTKFMHSVSWADITILHM